MLNSALFIRPHDFSTVLIIFACISTCCAFSYCTSLSAITVPHHVTSIENGTFKNCFSLSDISIPSRVTTIGDDAFSGCSSISKIILPSSLTDIGSYVFSGCNSLTRVTILADIPPLVGYDTFKDLPLSRAALYIPLGTRYNYAPNDPWKNFGQIIEIDPAALTTITQDPHQSTGIYAIDGRPVSSFTKPGTITIRCLPDGTTSKQIIR